MFNSNYIRIQTVLYFQGSKISEQNIDKKVYPRENKNTICLLKNHFNSNFLCRGH